MTNWLTIFPEPLLDPEKLADWTLFLRQLPLPLMRKKELCINYAKMQGLGKVATKELVESVIGEKRR